MSMPKRELCRRFARVTRELTRLLEAALEQEDAPVSLQPMEQAILEAIGDRTMLGKQIAKASGYSYSARLRLVLADLTRRNLLAHTPDGYRRAAPPEQSSPGDARS